VLTDGDISGVDAFSGATLALTGAASTTGGLTVSVDDVAGYLRITHQTRGGDYRITTSGTTAENLAIKNGATNILLLSNAGRLSLPDTIIAKDNQNGDFIFGRVKIGDALIGDTAVFAHYDHYSTINYALKQGNGGTVALNGPAGTTLSLRINNSEVVGITATAVTLASAKNLVLTDGDISGVDAFSGATLALTGAATVLDLKIAGFQIDRISDNQYSWDATLGTALTLIYKFGGAAQFGMQFTTDKVDFKNGALSSTLGSIGSAGWITNNLPLDAGTGALSGASVAVSGAVTGATISGAISTDAKITAAASVPASFADLAEVQTFLASILN
jgi:hypothetical protein